MLEITVLIIKTVNQLKYNCLTLLFNFVFNIPFLLGHPTDLLLKVIRKQNQLGTTRTDSCEIFL